MKKGLKIILILSLAINVLFLLVGGIYVLKKGGISYVFTKTQSVFGQNQVDTPQSAQLVPYYVDRKSLFKTLPIQTENIVFLGDSLIDRGEWEEYFQNKNIINRGINDDTTDGILKRLNTITKGKPDKIFIMAGINDLKYGINNGETINNFKEIIKEIKDESPGTKVFIHSILPIDPDLDIAKRKVNDVLSLNNRLEKLTTEQGATYINLYPLFEKDNKLNRKYTIDGIHLNGQGYKVWENGIAKYITE